MNIGKVTPPSPSYPTNTKPTQGNFWQGVVTHPRQPTIWPPTPPPPNPVGPRVVTPPAPVIIPSAPVYIPGSAPGAMTRNFDNPGILPPMPQPPVQVEPPPPPPQQQPPPAPPKPQGGGRDPSKLKKFSRGTEQFARQSCNGLTLTDQAQQLKDDILNKDPKDAAASLMKACATGKCGDAAAAVVSAAADGNAWPVAKVLCNMPKSQLSTLLTMASKLAVSCGCHTKFSFSISITIGWAQQQHFLPTLVPAIAEAVISGGLEARFVYGSAIATAIAGENSGAVAEATATAMCSGGSTAEAWSEAYAVAIEQDEQGCTVLKEAHAMAYARCGPGYAESWAKTESTSTVLGYCGVWDSK